MDWRKYETGGSRRNLGEDYCHCQTAARRGITNQHVAPLTGEFNFQERAQHIRGQAELSSWHRGNEMVRPYLSDVYAALHSVDSFTSKAPRGMVWTKQWRHASLWLQALLGEHGKLTRVYRVATYFGRGIKLALVTDASPHGLGAVLYLADAPIRYFSSKVDDEDARLLHFDKGTAASQQILEALALLQALRTWQSWWMRDEVSFSIISDSTSTLSLVSKLRTSSHGRGMRLIARELSLLFGNCAHKPRMLEHIPGVANVLADALSRKYQPGYAYKLPPALHEVREVHISARSPQFYCTLTAASQRAPE